MELFVHSGEQEMADVVEGGRWWPLCLSEEVLASKPVGLSFDQMELALFRDSAGHVRAVEDRCPHRRAPLSLGKITAEGHIQCGYHGWIFDGASGEVTGFPNLDPGERLPQCSLETFHTSEINGWIFLWRGRAQPSPVTVQEESPLPATAAEFHGRAMQALTHGECVAALLDCPGLLVRYLGVEFLEKTLGDPVVSGGNLVADRAARWNLLGESALYLGPLRHRADFPLRLHTYTVPLTGLTTASLYRDEDRLLARVQLALVPAARSMTAMHWRAAVYPDAHGKLAPLIKVLCALGRSPFGVASKLDCDALAAVLPGPGGDWRRLSETEPGISRSDVAVQTGDSVDNLVGGAAL
jgi:nitrite reductase/ring-hydroxylating ferredoxin subunit